MPTIANPFVQGKAVDLTSSINIIPNRWGLIQQLGLFREEPKAQKTVQMLRRREGDAILIDRNWDERNSNLVGGAKEYLTLPIPHFPVDDAITPNDVDGVIDFESFMTGGNGLLTVDQVRAEKMDRIRRAHSLTLEYARAQLIRDGSVYAPNNTVAINYYTEFGITRENVNVDLDSTTTNPKAQVEAVIAKLQDNLKNGEVVSDFIALCSPTFFSALTSNQFVYESYQYFSQTQGAGVLNQRLGSGQFDARYRVFEYGGVLFVEVRGSVGGTPYVEEDKAYVFPRGVSDMFRTFYAPANRFSTVNKVAQMSYYFEYLNRKDDIIEIMTETNFLNAVTRPELIITLTNAEVSE